jgi:anti-sigma-K factor RskA
MSAPGEPGRHERRDEHEAFDELAVGWALHALEPEDEAAFGAHLAGCRRCEQTVAETAEVMAALAADLPSAEPSPSLRDRLRAAVEGTEQLPAPAEDPWAGPRPSVPSVAAEPPSRSAERVPSRHPAGALRPASFEDLRPPGATRLPDRRPVWRRVLPHALVAAAVAAVLALGAWNVVLSGDRAAVQAVAEQQQDLLDALLQPGQATIAPLTDNGDPLATVVARDGQVQVVTTGLPINDSSNNTYVVWGVREQESPPVPLGTFDVVSPQMDLRTVGSSATGLDDFSAYAISIEPGREAPATPSDIVANGQVTS